MSEHPFSRRHFFFGSLLAGSIPTGGFGRSPSPQAPGHKPFSEKLNVAVIGCGPQGTADMAAAAQTENIVAVCDVDENRAGAARKRYAKAAQYKDYRVMLDKEGKNIDAVLIAVPDFMHATVALACMERGKHVYVEKPLTTTPWEARLLHDAALKYKVATQMGNQGFSHEAIRVTAEMIWSGAIGDVTEAHIATTPGTHPTGLQTPPPTSPVPAGLDWELWQGRAEPRAFSDEYVPYNWRGFLDYGTGQIGNWATHCASPVQYALLLTAPTSVECVSQEGKSDITYPNRGVVRMEFPARENMPAVTVYYHDSAQSDDPDAYHVPGMENETILPRPNNLAAKGRAEGGAPATGRGGAVAAPAPPPVLPSGGAPRQRTSPGGAGVKVFGPPLSPSRPGIFSGNGAVFIGTKGIMATCDRGEGVHLLPAARWQEYVLPPKLLTRSPGHMADWVRACKGGDASCSDFRITAPFAEWLALTMVAWRVPGKLEWDSKNLRFTNNKEANNFVRPHMRRGWDLKV